MQKIKATVSLLVAVLFLVITIPYSNVSAAELRYGKTVISQMDNKEALTYLYNNLVDACKKDTPQEIEINTAKYKITSAELINLYHIFLADYPEYFWLDGSCKYGNDKKDYVCVLIPSYSIEGSSLKKANTAFQNKVNSLIEGLNGKSDYEKSLILHNRLAENTTYDFSLNDQNAYGALVDGVAVCAGYSKAYQHLLHKVGIPAWCVMGTSLNPANDSLEAHEWNLVSLDGNWYYTDVTWDDQDEFLFYAYFNITTKQLEENHTITEFNEYLPNATATENNYFYKNNLIFTTLDINRLAKLLKENDYHIKIYVDEKSKDKFINDLSWNFNRIMQKTGMPPGYTYSSPLVISVGGEIEISLNLIEPNHQHSLSLVAAKNATCTARGNIAYYTCSCGKWFSDSTATTEITDKQSVKTPAVSHSYSSWTYDNINHWKECTKCGAEMANSMDHHTDSDSNSKCDTCAYNLPKDQIAASPAPSNPIQNNTVSNTSSKVTSTESSQESSSSSETTSEETVFEPDDIPVPEAVPKKKIPLLPVAIGGASVAVISAGVAIFFILKYK